MKVTRADLIHTLDLIERSLVFYDQEVFPAWRKDFLLVCCQFYALWYEEQYREFKSKKRQ
jgi:hypothetical protein